MPIIDVLLINLPLSSAYARARFAEISSLPPLGLLYIGAMLEKHAYKVKVLDLAVDVYEDQDLVALLTEQQPKIIGLSTYSECWQSHQIIARIIKNTLPTAKIVAGGAFATFCYEDVLNQTATDYVVRGEGEFAMLKLCDLLIRNDTNLSPEQISGLCWKDGGALQIAAGFSVNEGSLSELPMPDRRLIDISKYKMPFSISTARGCPGGCIFCSSRAFWGAKVRFRSASSVFAEVMDLYDHFNNSFFYIADDTFTASAQRTREFCRLMQQSGKPIKWGCESRADVITEDLIKEMKAAGCVKIQIGLESANNEVLKQLKKYVTIEEILNGVRIAAKYGLEIVASYIVGHAFDTHETVQQTLAFARFLQNEYNVNVMGSVNTPFPGTEQYHRASELGIHIYANDWDSFSLGKPIISTKNLSREDLIFYFNDTLAITNRNHYGRFKTATEKTK